MAVRIVCRVLQRPDGVTFVWSQDDACFEPYHLNAAEAAQFYQAADGAHQELGGVLAGNDAARAALAQAGHDMYRLIFRTQAGTDTPARKVEQWLQQLADQSGQTCNHWVSNVASFEIATDAPGRIPWNLVCEEMPKSPPDLRAFWGMRYPICAGRRVHSLPLNPYMLEPDVLQVLDPALPAEVLQLWRQSAASANLRTVSTRADLLKALRTRCPDLLCWVGSFDGGQLTLGRESISLKEMRRCIDEADDGSSEPLWLLHAFGDGRGWSGFLHQAALAFPGLITWEMLPAVGSTGAPESTAVQTAGTMELTAAGGKLMPPTGGAVVPLGHNAFERLQAGGASLGQILRDLRQKEGWPGLGLTAFCPPATFLGPMGPDVEVGRPRIAGRLPDAPFSPLASLDSEGRPLLAGRELDVIALASLLDEQNSGLVLLHGGAGVGKSSFVRAGVIPFLEEDSLGFYILRDRSEPPEPVADERDYPMVTVRASRDLAGQLASALCSFCDQPYSFTSPTGEKLTVPLPDLLRQAVGGDVEVVPTQLWDIFDRDPTALARVLEAVSRPLPSDLVIIIEQGEELFTQARADEDEKRRARALRMLAGAAQRAPRCKLVVSIRSEYLGRLRGELADNELDGAGGLSFVREYALAELTQDQLLDVLMLPTATEPIPYSGEVPHSKYRLTFGESFVKELVGEVVAAARKNCQSPIALLHVVGHRLHDRARKRGLTMVDKVDLRVVGGVDDGVFKMVEARLKSLPVAASLRKHLRTLLTGFSVGHSDGTVTRDTFSMEEMEQAWPGVKADAERTIRAAEDAGLIELQELQIAGKPGTYGSLPQDSIARVAQDWQARKKRDRYAYDKVVDTLYFVLPLLVLCTVVAWRWGQFQLNPQLQEHREKAATLEMQLESLQLPKYLGDLARAQEAWQNGTIDRMRKILLAQQALPFTGNDKEKLVPDLRGFEWYYLWHQANSERLALKWHRDTVTAVAVSPDGRLCASCSPEGEEKLLLWEVGTGKKRGTLKLKLAPEALAFSSDGKYLAAAAGMSVQLWLTEDLAKQVRLLEGHTDTVLALASPLMPASPEDPKQKDAKPKDQEKLAPSLLASAGADGKIILWDLSKDDKDAKLHTLEDKEARDKKKAAGEKDKKDAREKDAKDAEPKDAKDVKDTKKDAKDDWKAPAVRALAFAGPRKLASGDAAGKVLVWDFADLKKPIAIDAAAGPIGSLAFTPDGKKLLVGCTAPVGEFSPGEMAGLVHTFDPATGKKLDVKAPRHGSELFSLCLSRDGKTLATAGKDNFVRLWDGDTLREIGTIKGHLGWVRCLAFTPDGQSLISGSFDSTVKVWRPAPSESSEVLKRDLGPMTSLAISADGKFLAAGGLDRKVYLWDVAASKLLRPPFLLPGPVVSVAFARVENGQSTAERLAIAARDVANRSFGLNGVIQVWDLAYEKDELKVAAVADNVLAYEGEFPCLALAPDGKVVAWAEGTSIVRLDLSKKDGKPAELPPLVSKGAQKPISRLCFSPDAKMLAAAADDRLHIWNLETDREFSGSPYPAEGRILALTYTFLPAFQEDFLISSGADRSIRLWAQKKNDAFSNVRFHYAHSPANALAGTPLQGNEFFQGNRDNSISIALLRFVSSDVVFTTRPETFLLRGHTAPVRALALSPDHHILASTGDDGTVRLWRAADLKEPADR